MHEPCVSAFLSLVPVVVTITMPVMIVEVAVLIVIPAVIVFNAAAVSLPVPHIISVAVVVRCNPTSSFVRWSSPIALMPFVVFSHWIPITLYPHMSRIWHCGDNHSHPERRWRPNHDSNGNLRFTYPDGD
jgi:hypothetical protein